MIDVNLKGTHLHRGRDASPPDRLGRGRLRLARERRRRTGLSGRGGLQRVQVRPGRFHARARPRDARARRARRRTSAPAACTPTSRSARTRGGDPQLEGMLAPRRSRTWCSSPSPGRAACASSRPRSGRPPRGPGGNRHGPHREGEDAHGRAVPWRRPRSWRDERRRCESLLRVFNDETDEGARSALLAPAARPRRRRRRR